MRMGVPGQNYGGHGRPAPASMTMAVKARFRDEDDESDELEGNGQVAKRFYLAMDDDIVDAPSIGPRTAERLREHGIN